MNLYAFGFGWMGSCVVAAESPEEALELVKLERPYESLGSFRFNRLTNEQGLGLTVEDAVELFIENSEVLWNDFGDQ